MSTCTTAQLVARIEQITDTTTTDYERIARMVGDLDHTDAQIATAVVRPLDLIDAADTDLERVYRALEVVRGLAQSATRQGSPMAGLLWRQHEAAEATTEAARLAAERASRRPRWEL